MLAVELSNVYKTGRVMKGSARLIGVDRQGITRHNKELQGRHVMQLIQNGAVGNPIGPTVYAAR